MDPLREEPDSARGWAFGPFALYPDRGLMSTDGSEVELAAKPLAVLCYLVASRDRVVARQELLEALWPGLSVGRAAFDSVIRDLRRALGDTASEGAYITTVRNRGVRFSAEVQDLTAKADVNAWEAATVHFERALTALAQLETSTARLGFQTQPERAELLVALARARWASGATAEARRAFVEAAEVGRRLKSGEVLARAALGFAGRTDMTLGKNDLAVSLLEEALAMLPATNTALRAEVMARLGTESIGGLDTRRADDLTREAVAIANQVGDPGVLAYALTARHFALQRPEIEPTDRLPLDEQIFALLPDHPPSDVLALALQQRIVDLLELGEGEAFARTLDRYLEVAKGLDQPFFSWIGEMLAGTRSLLSGDIEDAEESARRTFEIGERIGSANALPALAGQLFGVRHAQNRLAELVPMLDQIDANQAAIPLFRAGRTAALAAAGPTSAALAALGEFMRGGGLRAIPRDQNWLATLGILAPVVATLGSKDQIRTIARLLAAYANRIIVVGQGAAILGAVSHYLGLLAMASGESLAASRHFDHAEAMHQRLQSPLWLDRTRHARGVLP